MIGRVLDALDCTRFQSLIGVCERLDRLFADLRDGGKPLRANCLSGTQRSYLAGVGAKLIWSGFQITLPFRCSLIGWGECFCVLDIIIVRFHQAFIRG